VNSVATNYTYDEIDQLKSEISNNQFGVHDLYTYDANGNRSTKLSAIGGFTEYGYDDADKLMSVTKSGNTTTYTYDACGRPTNIGSRVLNWDYEDRLTDINSGGVPTTNYGYNGVGTRWSDPQKPSHCLVHVLPLE
jgi:YD repeat-containing protein